MGLCRSDRFPRLANCLIFCHTLVPPTMPLHISLAIRPALVMVVIWLLFGLTLAAHGAELQGRVVRVADGDTLTLRDAQGVQHRIRLQGIDAPEMEQPFGDRSRQYLIDLVYRREVTVVFSRRDAFDRAVGVIFLDGEDINLRMVAAGKAWHFSRMARHQSPADRSAYADAEQAARQARLGLWTDPNPIPPWDFRRPSRP